MRILRNKAAGLHIKIGKITPSATGYQDFFPRSAVSFENQHAASPTAGSPGAHQARCPCADDNDIKVGQTDFPQLAGTAAENAGGVTKFLQLNKDKLHMFLPASNSVLPWTALIIGLWIPNFYYWGLNQYITQRTLAAKTLRQGQVGIIFAAVLKLLIPFIIIFPANNNLDKKMKRELKNCIELTGIEVTGFLIND